MAKLISSTEGKPIVGVIGKNQEFCGAFSTYDRAIEYILEWVNAGSDDTDPYIDVFDKEEARSPDHTEIYSMILTLTNGLVYWLQADVYRD